MKKTVLITFALLTTLVSVAQETPIQPQPESQETNETVYKPTMHFSGFAHMFYSVAETAEGDYIQGASIRRLRFKPYGTITEKVGYGFQLGFDKQAFKLLDVYMTYKMCPVATLKVGQFAPPALRSGAFGDDYFSTTKMTLVQRSQMTQSWLGIANTSSYRDFGIQIDGTVLDKKLYYGVMLANPYANEIFTPSVKDASYSQPDNGFKGWGRLEYFPIKELAIGGFGGYSMYSNKDVAGEDSVNTMFSAGAHAIYRSDNLRFMTEWYTASKGPDTLLVTSTGLFVEAGYKMNKIEPAVRYDFYTPNVGENDKNGVETYSNITLGLNYYMNKKMKIQANYVYRMEAMAGDADEIYNNLFLINLQYAFGDK